MRFPGFRLLPYAAAIAALATTFSAPVRAADAEHGHQLARQWCASCHLIDNSGTGTTIDMAPSFPSVAADPQKSDEKRLAAWLQTSHPQMPNFDLSRNNIADLVAYIRSLAKH